MGALALWTIYDHPTDKPDAYVARRFAIGAGAARPEQLAIVADDLDAIRSWLATAGLVRLPRSASDDPVIVESWL